VGGGGGGGAWGVGRGAWELAGEHGRRGVPEDRF
jgi:hypothetical protein